MGGGVQAIPMEIVVRLVETFPLEISARCCPFEVTIVLAFRGEVLWYGRLVRGRGVGCFSLLLLLRATSCSRKFKFEGGGRR